MEFSIRLTSNDDYNVVSVSGEIDIATAPKLKETIAGLLEKGNNKIVLDLEEVPFMDSSGLGVLLSGLKGAREADGVFAIACSNPSILKVFELTGLKNSFPIYADVAEAVKQRSS